MVLRIEDPLEKGLSVVQAFDTSDSHGGDSGGKVVEPKTVCPTLTSDLALKGQGGQGHDDKLAAVPLLSSGAWNDAGNKDDDDDDDDDDDNGDNKDAGKKAYNNDDETDDDNFDKFDNDDDNNDDDHDDDDDDDDDDIDGEDDNDDMFNIDDINALAANNNEDDDNIDDNDNNNDDEDVDEDALIPDGGWGWVVCFGSFMVNFICDGTMFSFGILLLDLLKDIGSDKATTSWAGGALVGFSMVAGPLVSYLLESYSLRQVTIVGAVLTLIGFTASAFSVNVYMFILTYGVIGGTGISLSFLPAIIVVGVYFNKKRALATGIATSGSGLGTFAYAYIANGLLQEYHWRGTVLILGGLVLNSAVCGMFFRPITTRGLAAAAAAKKKKQRMELEGGEAEEHREEFLQVDDVIEKPERHQDDGSASSGYSSDKALHCLKQDHTPLLPSPLVVVVVNEDDKEGDDDGDDVDGGGDDGDGGGDTNGDDNDGVDRFCDGVCGCVCTYDEDDVEGKKGEEEEENEDENGSRSYNSNGNNNNKINHYHQSPRSQRRDTAGSSSLIKDAILNRQRRERPMSETSSATEDRSVVKCSADSTGVSPSPYNSTNSCNNNNTITNNNKNSNTSNKGVLGDILNNCSIDTNVITIEDMDSGELVYHQLIPQTSGNNQLNQPNSSNKPTKLKTDTQDKQPNSASSTEKEDNKYFDYESDLQDNDNNDSNSDLCQIRLSSQQHHHHHSHHHSDLQQQHFPAPRIITPSSQSPSRPVQNDNHHQHAHPTRLYQSAGHLHGPSKYTIIAQSPHPKTSQELNGYHHHHLNNNRLMNSEYKLDDYPTSHLGVMPINRSPKIHSRSSGHLKSYNHSVSGQDLNLKTHDPSNAPMTASRSAYFQHQISKGLLRPILRQDIYYGGSVNHLTASKQFGSVASFVAAMTRASSTESGDVKSQGAESTRGKGRGKTSCFSSAFLFKNRTFILLLITFTMWTAQSVSLTYIPDLAVSRGISRPDAAFLISIVGIANVLGRLVAGLVTDLLRVRASCLYVVALATASGINLIIAFGYSYILLCFSSAVFGLCMGVAVSMRTIVLAEELGIEFLTQSFGIVAMFQGVAFTVNPPIAGKLIDDTGSFKPPFLMVSAMYAVSAISMAAVIILNRCRPVTTFTTTTRTIYSSSNSSNSHQKNNNHHHNNSNHYHPHQHQHPQQHHHLHSSSLFTAGDDDMSTSHIIVDTSSAHHHQL